MLTYSQLAADGDELVFYVPCEQGPLHLVGRDGTQSMGLAKRLDGHLRYAHILHLPLLNQLLDTASTEFPTRVACLALKAPIVSSIGVFLS